MSTNTDNDTTTNERENKKTPESGSYLVCDGATCKCSAGAVPYVPLDLMSQMKAYIQDKLAATVEDGKLPPLPFATCTLNPDKKSGQPCNYSTPGKWELKANSEHPTICGKLFLTDTAKMICPVFGGSLSIFTHGQSVGVPDKDTSDVDETLAASINPFFEPVEPVESLTQEEKDKLKATSVNYIKYGDKKSNDTDNEKSKHIYLRLGQNVEFEAVRGSGGDEKSVGWQIWTKTENLSINDEESEIYENVGTKLPMFFKQAGDYSVEAFGKKISTTVDKELRKGVDKACVLYVHVIDKNKIETIHNNRTGKSYSPSEEIKLIKGLKYEFDINGLLEFDEEELDQIIVQATDQAGGMLLREYISCKRNKLFFKAPNTASYEIQIQFYDQTINFPILAVDNELMGVACKAGDAVRPGTDVNFTVKLKEEIGRDIDRVSWVIKKPNNTFDIIPPRKFGNLELNYKFTDKGSYEIGATLDKTDKYRGDKSILGIINIFDWGKKVPEMPSNKYTLTIKENEVSELKIGNNSTEITVSVGSTLEIKSFFNFGNYIESDGKIVWHIIDKTEKDTVRRKIEGSKKDISVLGTKPISIDDKSLWEKAGELYSGVDDWKYQTFKDDLRLVVNRTGTYEVRAILRDSNKVDQGPAITIKVEEAEILRWCFTDSKGNLKTQSGWRQEIHLNIQVKGWENKSGTINLYLDRRSSSNHFVYLRCVEINRETFADFNGQGQCTVKIDADSDLWDTLEKYAESEKGNEKFKGNANLLFTVSDITSIIKNGKKFEYADKSYTPLIITNGSTKNIKYDYTEYFPIEKKPAGEIGRYVEIVDKTVISGFFSKGDQTPLKEIIKYGDSAAIVSQILYSREDAKNKEKLKNKYYIQLVENRIGDQEDYKFGDYVIKEDKVKEKDKKTKKTKEKTIQTITQRIVISDWNDEGIFKWGIDTNKHALTPKVHDEYGYAPHVPRCFYFIIFDDKAYDASAQAEDGTRYIQGEEVYTYPEGYSHGEDNNIYVITEMQGGATQEDAKRATEFNKKLFGEPDSVPLAPNSWYNAARWRITLPDVTVEDLNKRREDFNDKTLNEKVKNDPIIRLNYFLQLKIAKDTILNNSFAETVPVKIGEGLATGQGNCGGKFCITRNQPYRFGDKEKVGKLIQEINIRLAGFGGNVPTKEFDERTENTIRQFQRDYMGITPTGKICGGLLKAIDEFSSKFDLSSKIWEDLDCSCSTRGQTLAFKTRSGKELNQCQGWGDQSGKDEYRGGHTKNEAYHNYEYPGLHRSLLFGLKGLLFYISKQSEYKFAHISSGYRCRFKQYESTNHQGKAIDMQFEKGSKLISGEKYDNLPILRDIRDKFFVKYLNVKKSWKNDNGTVAVNHFSVEPIDLLYKANGKVRYDHTFSWIHLDVRQYEEEYLHDEYFCKSKETLNRKTILSLAQELGFAYLCTCAGASTPQVINSTVINYSDCPHCKIFDSTASPKQREAYYKEVGTKMIKYIESIGVNNKFKGLYLLAQRRSENGFDLNTPLNNPMNITSKGDLGRKTMSTQETENGVLVNTTNNFGAFSSEEAGFNGYIELLKDGYNDAYSALIDTNKTIHDFAYALEYSGKYGVYATGKAKGGLSAIDSYVQDVKDNFNNILKNYKDWYNCMLTCPNHPNKEQIKKDIELLNKIK